LPHAGRACSPQPARTPNSNSFRFEERSDRKPHSVSLIARSDLSSHILYVEYDWQSLEGRQRMYLAHLLGNRTRDFAVKDCGFTRNRRCTHRHGISCRKRCASKVTISVTIGSPGVFTANPVSHALRQQVFCANPSYTPAHSVPLVINESRSCILCCSFQP
jgi:hypothetical protein